MLQVFVSRIIIYLFTIITVEYCKNIVKMPGSHEAMRTFRDVICGKYGSTAAYWATYMYLINRVYRQLKRAVCTNDVDGYIHSLPSIIEVCFALNRPNYSRWGSLFSINYNKWIPELGKF